MTTFTIRDLQESIESNNVESVMMIHLGGLFNLVNNPGDSSFLQKACSNQALDSVEYIISQPDIDINYQNGRGESALHNAVSVNNPKICDILLRFGADPNVRTADNGETPLYRLIRNALESKVEINRTIFEMLINHPKFNINIMSIDNDGNDINLIDLITKSILTSKEGKLKLINQNIANPDDSEDEDNLPPLEDNKNENINKNIKEDIKVNDISYYLGQIIEIYKKQGINWNLEKVYREVFKTCKNFENQNCVQYSIKNMIKLLENLFTLKQIPEKIDEKNLYLWVLDQIQSIEYHERIQILEVMNRVFTDRSEIYQERKGADECSILEDILRNGDIDQIKKSIITIGTSNITEYDYSRRCKKHKCTPIGKWLQDLVEVNDIDQFQHMLKTYGRLCNGLIHYYANGVNWQRLNFLATHTTNSVLAFQIMLKCGFPLPNLIGDNKLPDDRKMIINNFRFSKEIFPEQLKDTIANQCSIFLPNKLTINQLELIDMDPVEEIDPLNYIIMSNGVAWDMNNFLQYIVDTTHGNNMFDTKTKIEELKNQPIWGADDIEYLKQLSTVHGNLGIRTKIKRALEYINSEEHRKCFSPVDREEIRRFASIFGSHGAWWDYELKKVSPEKLYNEWQERKAHQSGTSMPGVSDDLYKIAMTLKGKYLLYYKYFTSEMSATKKKALVMLNSNMTENYQQATIKGKNCIMQYSRDLKVIVGKFGLTTEEMNKSLVQDYQLRDVQPTVSDKEKELLEEEIRIQMYPSVFAKSNGSYDM